MITEGDWKVQVSTNADGEPTNDIRSGCKTIACDIPNDDDAFLMTAAPALRKCCERYIKMQDEVYKEMGKKPSSTTYQIMKEAVEKSKKPST